VITRLAGGALGSMHLAPPDVTDVEDIEHFVFGHDHDGRMEDLDLGLYCSQILERGLDMTIESLRRAKVGVVYGGTEQVHFLWSAFDCIVAEIPDGAGRLFVLSGGTWYQIEEDFARQVADAVNDRSRDPEFLPLRLVSETEPAYNQRAALETGFHRLDGCLARPAGAASPLEFCDLLCNDGRIVHVKRRSRSSTLSHLFAQGLLSAELFVRERTFRTDLVAKLTERGQSAAAALIPESRPDPAVWEIVYAVLSDSGPDDTESLPFFSQLNFKIAAERLENLNYRVSLRQIPTGAA
jgi:uncharacterized protein (TIGR04141 family)